MLATYASAALLCVGALILGQSVLWLCGATRWSWVAPPVGMAAMLLIAVPSLHVPGRGTTVFVVLGLAVAAGAVLMVRQPAHRPPVGGLLAGLPVLVLTGAPFLAAGNVGMLGWSFNNDMAFHLLWADIYRSSVVEHVNALPPNYPLGPHALVGVVGRGLGVGSDAAFTGLTIAAVVLLGWTSLGALRHPRWWAPAATAFLVGMPFLVAGYYGQGAFKEVLEALLVLGAAVLLAFPPALGRLRQWIPLAVILAGTVSVYSFLGLAWPLAFLGLFVAGVLLVRLAATWSVRAVLREARAVLAPACIAAAVAVVALIPQLPRLIDFISIRNTSSATGVTGIPKDNLGNLAGRLPFWESLGIWRNPDFRLPTPEPFTNGLWSGLAIALVIFGAAWALRRREWLLVAAAAISTLIWVVSDRTQSPYVAAKALIILCPLLMLVAARALGERDVPGRRMPSWWWLAAPALAVLLVVQVAGSSWDALRQSRVGSMAHTRELRALQPLLGHRPTLFLGNDDFIQWELSSTRVAAPVIGFPTMTFRPQKPWAYGQDYDIDSIGTGLLNGYDWVITPRDAAASALPPQLRLVRETRSFALYRRAGRVADRQTLDEGQASAVKLDCRTPLGRRLLRRGGVAAIRSAPIVVPVAPMPAGAYAPVMLPLTPGTWDLVTPYTGQRALRVTGPGLRTTLAANLDRPGPRWPIGRIVVRDRRPVRLLLHTTKSRWTPAGTLTSPGAIVAVRAGTERTVPISQACGKLVDWYEVR